LFVCLFVSLFGFHVTLTLYRSYRVVPALLVEEDLVCPSVHYFRHERAHEYNHRHSVSLLDSFLTGKFLSGFEPTAVRGKWFEVNNINIVNDCSIFGLRLWDLHFCASPAWSLHTIECETDSDAWCRKMCNAPVTYSRIKPRKSYGQIVHGLLRKCEIP
jgi:hypothetical protein